MKNEGGLDVVQARFVLLRHLFSEEFSHLSHWDLMLEAGKSLFTLKFLELPQNSSDQHVRVERLQDHRLRYLDYEGAISGDRGHVHRIAAGRFIRDSAAGSIQRVELDARELHANVEFPPLAVGQSGTLHVCRWALRV